MPPQKIDLMKNLYLRIGVAALGVGLAAGACGDSGLGPNPQATTDLCDEIFGLEAIYFDLVNGVPRGDLPSTAFTIPFNIDINQSPYSNNTSLLLGFTSVPQGWTVSDAVDFSGFAIPGTVAATDLVRADNRAVWRYTLSAQVSGGFTSQAILESEINAVLGAVGNPGPITAPCSINAQTQGILGPESVAARVLRAGDFTIVARTHVLVVSGVTATHHSFVSVAPTTEHERVINDIFVPMITQLYGGGTDPAQCSDGIDNDNDGATDYPSDNQCSSPGDDNESS